MKNMTLRLDDQDAAILEMIARAEGRTVADVLREAVDHLILQRRRTPEFMAKLRHSVDESARLLSKFEEEKPNA